MCGIVGWIDFGGIDAAQGRLQMQTMIDVQAHRGPDASGLWLSTTAALGHRRLAVVDVANGSQPMSLRRGDREYVIVYNGELYNTDELRDDLIVRGHRFRTRSDTEVVLAAYAEWGPACVERLNAIFAFAVWSVAEQRLFLARDRLGVKPLFYARRGGAFLFGSELKALLSHAQVDAVLDDEGLSEVFLLGPSRTPGHGVFRGVSELCPASWIIHERERTQIQVYWRLESRPHTDDVSTTAATLRELVIDSVRRQLVSDVPIATFLSGGLDSSIISAVAADKLRAVGDRLQTWSVDYRDGHFEASRFQPDPDGPWAKRVSQFLGTDHHEVLIDAAELPDSLTWAVRGRDLPGQTDIDASLLLLCRSIKSHATVALSGECADEIFGGYWWLRDPATVAADEFPWLRRVSERARLLHPDIRGRLRPDAYVRQRFEESVTLVPKLVGEDPTEARHRTMLYLAMRWFMATLLDRKDRMSMLSGLEVRVPFCDHRIVEYAWNIPWAMKQFGGRSKGILRKAMEGILPDDVLGRDKASFPKAYDPAYGRAMRAWVRGLIADPTQPIHRVYDAAALTALTEAEPSDDARWFGNMGAPQLLAFIGQTNTWLREYRVTIS
jgi:asparagine synthase (glutamine-hydrolysing)